MKASDFKTKKELAQEILKYTTKYGKSVSDLMKNPREALEFLWDEIIYPDILTACH